MRTESMKTKEDQDNGIEKNYGLLFLYYLLILPHYTDGGHSSAELLVCLVVEPVTLRDLNVSER